jgi:hypothetical protein
VRDKRMCLRGPKGPQGPAGPRGSAGSGGSLSAPNIIEPPKPLAVNQSGNDLFTCVAKGNPTPKVTWSRPKSLLPVGRHVVHSNGSLSIKQVTSNDSGSYICTATSVLGKAQAQSSLTVQGLYMPRIHAPISKKLVRATLGRHTGHRSYKCI